MLYILRLFLAGAGGLAVGYGLCLAASYPITDGVNILALGSSCLGMALVSK